MDETVALLCWDKDGKSSLFYSQWKHGTGALKVAKTLGYLSLKFIQNYGFKFKTATKYLKCLFQYLNIYFNIYALLMTDG